MGWPGGGKSVKMVAYRSIRLQTYDSMGRKESLENKKERVLNQITYE